MTGHLFTKTAWHSSSESESSILTLSSGWRPRLGLASGSFWLKCVAAFWLAEYSRASDRDKFWLDENSRAWERDKFWLAEYSRASDRDKFCLDENRFKFPLLCCSNRASLEVESCKKLVEVIEWTSDYRTADNKKLLITKLLPLRSNKIIDEAAKFRLIAIPGRSIWRSLVEWLSTVSQLSRSCDQNCIQNTHTHTHGK